MPSSARWCGHCGAALADERAVVDALAFGPGRVPDQPAAGASALAGPSGPPAAPAGGSVEPDAPPAGERVGHGSAARLRRLRLAVVVTVVVVPVAAALLRPAQPGLHEVRPAGWGSADGRDASRTGEVAAPAIGKPDDGGPIDQWGFAGPREERYVDTSIVGPAVLVRRDDELTALRRDDGSVIGDFPLTFEAHVVDDLLVTLDDEVGPAVLTATRIPTGEQAWTRRLPGGSVRVLSLGDRLLVATTNDEGAPALVSVGADGQLQWEVAIAGPGWSAWVADAYDGLAVVEAIRDAAFSDDGGPRPEDIAEYVVDVADGATRRLPVDLPAPWEEGSLVLLGDGRAAVSLQGEARGMDLSTGQLQERLPVLDGGSFWAAGDYLAVVEPQGTSRLVRRRGLELLWRAGGQLDLSPLSTGGRVVAVHQTVGGDWLTSWREVDTGVHLTEATMNDSPSRPSVDHAGVVEVVDGVVTARTHGGGVTWTRHLAGGPAGSLQRAGDRLVASSDEASLAMGVDGEAPMQTRARVSRSGGSASAGVVVAGERILQVRGELLFLDDALSAVGTPWRRDLDAAITATVAGDEVTWVAAGGRIVAIDPIDGDTVGEVEASDVSSLSLAGDEALVAVSGATCADVRATCVPRVELFDATRLRLDWSVEVAGACGGATLAGDVVAVPTVDGLAFLARGDGTQVGRWQVGRRDCLEAAHHEGRFVLPATGGLVVGDRGGVEGSVLVDATITTAPVVLADGQVLVGTASGVAAADLDLLEVDWTTPVHGGVIAPPLVVDGRLYVLTPTRIVRLR